MNTIYKKLEEYKSLLDFNNEDRVKDFKGNLRFMEYAIKKMLKNKEDEDSIIKFIQDAINVHVSAYNKYLA